MLGEVYRPDSIIPEATVKRFLKNTEVKDYSDTKLMAVLKDLNIDIPFTVKKRVEIMDNATKDKQHSTALRALEGLENHLGLNQKVTISETRQTNSNLQDNFLKAKNDTKISISTEVNVPQNEEIKPNNEETASNNE